MDAVSSPKDAAGATACKIVFVPADSSEQMQEWTVPVPEGKEVEAVVNRIREHYTTAAAGGGAGRGAGGDDDGGKGAYKAQLRAQVEENARKMGNGAGEGSGAGGVSDAMLNIAADLQLVETVALLPGGPKTEHVHVNMYCDDRAISKGSPINERACGIASTCGLNTHVRGDVFIGRVLEDDERFERRDFTIGDLDSGSAWVTKARSLNIAKQMNAAGDGGNDMLARMQAMAGPDATVVGNPHAGAGGAAPQVSKMDGEGVTPEGSLYTWTQTEDEVVVEVRCPMHTTAKDIKCTFGPQSIKLAVLSIQGAEDGNADSTKVLEGKLFQRIDIDGSTWTIEKTGNERVLQVTLSKEQPMRWLVLTR